jgi:cell division protein FtsW (lipid II flippase)
MKNIFRIKVTRPMEILLTASVIALIIAYLLFGCEVSNKRHWIRVHHTDYQGIDSVKPVVKK